MTFLHWAAPRRAIPSLALVTTLVFAAAVGAPSARAADYTGLVAERSSLAFAYRQMGVAMEGQFRKFSAQLSFDPARPANARAAIDIEVASIDAGTSEANDEVAGKLWFNTKAHPVARFVASSFKATGPNRFDIAGRLTIKGHSHDLVIPASFTPQGAVGVLEGVALLKRADFGIGEGLWADFGTIANEVNLKFRLTLSAGK